MHRLQRAYRNRKAGLRILDEKYDKWLSLILCLILTPDATAGEDGRLVLNIKLIKGVRALLS